MTAALDSIVRHSPTGSLYSKAPKKALPSFQNFLINVSTELNKLPVLITEDSDEAEVLFDIIQILNRISEKIVETPCKASDLLVDSLTTCIEHMIDRGCFLDELSEITDLLIDYATGRQLPTDSLKNLFLESSIISNASPDQGYGYEWMDTEEICDGDRPGFFNAKYQVPYNLSSQHLYTNATDDGYYSLATAREYDLASDIPEGEEGPYYELADPDLKQAIATRCTSHSPPSHVSTTTPGYGTFYGLTYVQEDTNSPYQDDFEFVDGTWD